MRKLAAAFLFCALASWTTARADLTPTFTTFGPLSGATFGGSGIPNDAVAITTITDGAKTITLGLTAHQRFASPAVTNNGAGVFTAQVGVYPATANLALWNFAFYIEVDGGSLSDYQFNLLYDLDPGADTLSSTLGNINFASATGNPLQGSQNPGFNYLATGAPGVTPPSYTPFSALAAGEYTFALRASTLAGASLGQSVILVNTVPEPSTLLAAIGAIGAIGFVRHRRLHRKA